MRGGKSGKPPRPFSRSGSKKGRTTPLYLEGLKLAHLGLSSIYLYICRKLLQFRQREKRVVNAKKRGPRPEKSGGSPASACESPLFFHFMEKTFMGKNPFQSCSMSWQRFRGFTGSASSTAIRRRSPMSSSRRSRPRKKSVTIWTSRFSTRVMRS